MPLVNTLTFNELNGVECKGVILNRMKEAIDYVPYLQHHITLPRVRITVKVTIECWADQPNPELIPINDRFNVIIEDPQMLDIIQAESVDSTAPVAGGFPPDHVRAVHGLATPRPGPGPREIGGHAYTADIPVAEPEPVEDHRYPGMKVSRTGSIDGQLIYEGATVVKLDQGPAGLRQGEMRRSDFGLRHGTPPTRG